MPDLENYILSGVFFLVLCALFFGWKVWKKKKMSNNKSGFVYSILELAHSQYEPFNIKLLKEDVGKAGYTALIDGLDADHVHMDINGYVPEEYKGSGVEVYFKVRMPEGPVFYTFSSTVENIVADYENTQFTLAMPQHLQVEKKRHFVRVKPDREDIRVIGVWPIKPGKRLPKSTSEVGPAMTHYKPGMEHDPVQVENISGAGLALRFAGPQGDDKPMDIHKGSQLLCLVVYMLENSDHPIAFWCTGEVMNVRETTGKEPETVAGLEFTNWAVLEQASSEIHWAHNSPTRGARPILQWVEQIEKKRKS